MVGKAGAVVVVLGVVCAGGTTVPDGVVVIGSVVVVVGTSAPDLSAVVGALELGGACAFETCGVNGFFVSKTLNATSCPASDEGGASVSTSSPDDEVAAAVGVPPATFGRT